MAHDQYAESYYRTRDGQPNEHELWHVRRPLKVLRELFGMTPAADFGLDAAQCALGHTQANVTQVYAEKNQTLAAQVALKIG